MKRAKHTLSHYRLNTADMGQLVPIGMYPVLPGDTIQQVTNAVIRVSPLNTPVMHPVQVRIHHFFVPNRIVYPGWEDFITGGPDGNTSEQIPTTNQTAEKGSWLHDLGVPKTSSPITVNSMPLQAANLIYNEYYRDQDLETKRSLTANTRPFVAWEKDRFTVSRPWTQKGPNVSVPIGTEAPVGVKSNAPGGVVLGRDPTADLAHNFDSSGAVLQTNANSGPGTNANLVADLSNATAVDINAFRAAFSIQRYQEARARYGSRFTEYLRYLGITPSDARLQRPEFLGGGTTRLNFSEVLQTTPATEQGQPGVGDLYGHGIAGVGTRPFRKFCEEHGYVVTFLSVRPKTLYQTGLHREWKKTLKEDYYQRELSNLGQQEVMNSELYFADSGVFGYEDRYEEYRRHPSQVSGDFTDTLNSWHLGRELQSGVTLNADFIRCNPSKRIYQSTNTEGLWIMANHSIVARRMVPKRANPRIL